MIEAFRLSIPRVFIPYTPIELAVLGRKRLLRSLRNNIQGMGEKANNKPRNVQTIDKI